MNENDPRVVAYKHLCFRVIRLHSYVYETPRYVANGPQLIMWAVTIKSIKAKIGNLIGALEELDPEKQDTTYAQLTKTIESLRSLPEDLIGYGHPWRRAMIAAKVDDVVKYYILLLRANREA